MVISARYAQGCTRIFLRSIYLQVPTSPIFSVTQHSPDVALVARVPEPLGLLLVPNLSSQVLMLSVQ